MKRSRLVRVQLILLAVLVVLVVIRLMAGPPVPDGVVVMTDLEPHELRHEAFELREPARLAVQAIGSFQETGTPVLGAYGWIVRRDDRTLAWQMDAANVVAERGTLARVQDTLQLQPGVYDVYFTTFGNDINDHRPDFRADASRWQYIIRPLDRGVAERLSGEAGEAAPHDATVLWTTAPAKYGRNESFLFEVKQSTPIHIYALGELKEDQPMDYGWIDNAATGERVWEMTFTNTEPAGGVASNRRFEGDVVLDSGIYRATYQSDEGHDPRRWLGNPPYDPAGWGLTLTSPDGEGIAAFDPWQRYTPFIQLTEIPDGACRSQRFEVRQPARVAVYAVGEITDDDEVWDYGFLTQDAPSHRPVWKMSLAASQHAGGGEKNRTEIAFLALDPGQYTLAFRTDDSHAYDDWNSSKPDHPERWGVTLFPLENMAALRLIGTTGHTCDEAAAPSIPSVPGTPQMPSLPPIEAINAPIGPALIDWQRTGASFDEEDTLLLDAEAMLLIQALGEHTARGWHDYGWIENADNSEIVWSMTVENTRPAGGDDRNRRFDGVVKLPPGEYTVHYKTDFSHHYGDFGLDAPSNQEAWGIKIRQIEVH